MFRFGKEPTLPLSDLRTVSRWVGELPQADPWARQSALIGALADLIEGRLAPGVASSEALLALDDHALSLARTLIAQFVSVAGRTGQLERKVWDAMFALTQKFLQAYQLVLEAHGRTPDRKWDALEPRLLLHHAIHLGLDAEYRLFRFERWIPGKWQQLHQILLRARALRVDRTALPLGPATSSIEREYLKTVLLQLLDSGNLSPMQVASVADQLNEWVGLVRLASDRSQATFAIDLAARGEARRLAPGAEAAAGALLLDVRLLQAQLLRSQAVVRRKLAADPLSERTPHRQTQLGVLLKLARQLDPESSPLSRRGPRGKASGGLFALVGFRRICDALRDEDLRLASGRLPPVEAGRSRPPEPEDDASSAASATRRSLYGSRVEAWELLDTSKTGMRVSAPIAEGSEIAIGWLAAVRLEGQEQWQLGVVRRVRRLVAERAELGLQILAPSLLGVELEIVRASDQSYRVDGKSMSVASSRIRAVYVPRASTPHLHAERSIIVPPNAYDTRADYTLSSARASYQIRLGKVIEQHHQWVWCGLQVLTGASTDITVPADSS